MADRARLFINGGSQAVRLPKAYRFEGAEEVEIHRQGRRVILEPVPRRFSPEFLALAGSAPDFLAPAELELTDEGPTLE